jgi:hypothetical protein
MIGKEGAQLRHSLHADDMGKTGAAPSLCLSYREGIDALLDGFLCLASTH